MAKKTSAKQPTQKPATASQAEKFGLESIRTLQKQFDAAAQQYPHLMHVLILNREVTAIDKQLKARFAGSQKLQERFGSAERYVAFARSPQLPNEYYNEETLLNLWSDTPRECYRAGWRLLHWLIAPLHLYWDRSEAIHTLKALAEIGVRILTNLQVGKTLGLSDYVAVPSPFRSDIEAWVLSVHEFAQPEQHWFIPNATRPDGFFEVLFDVWISSSQLCARVLDLAEKQPGTQDGALKMQDLIDTRGGLTGTQSKLSPRSVSLILLKEHPHWTDMKIAKEANVNRTSHYRWPEYKQLRQLLHQQYSLPHGSKDRDTRKIEGIAED